MANSYPNACQRGRAARLDRRYLLRMGTSNRSFFVLVCISFLVLVAATLTGCRTGSSVTGGYEFAVRESDNQRKLVFYRLRDDGLFIYNAGISAAREDPTIERPIWQREFTQAEMEPILQLLRENDDPQTVEPRSEESNYKLTLRTPKHGEKRYVSGPTPFFVELCKRCRAAMVAKRPELSDPTIQVP